MEDEGDSKASIEKDGNNPKSKYEDKLNSNDDDRDAKEEEDICSRTSAKEITLDSSKAEEMLPVSVAKKQAHQRQMSVTSERLFIMTLVPVTRPLKTTTARLVIKCS